MLFIYFFVCCVFNSSLLFPFFSFESKKFIRILCTFELKRERKKKTNDTEYRESDAHSSIPIHVQYIHANHRCDGRCGLFVNLSYRVGEIRSAIFYVARFHGVCIYMFVYYMRIHDVCM